MTWREEAACRGEDSDLFFPTKGKNSRAARAVCAECPVTVECLDYALRAFSRQDDSGIWGGTAPRQRRAIRSRRVALRGVS